MMSENAVLPAGQFVAHVSDFFGGAVVGAVIVGQDTRCPNWRLIRVVYFDQWARQGRGELRQYLSWEPISTMRPLVEFVADGLKVSRAVLKRETATNLAAVS